MTTGDDEGDHPNPSVEESHPSESDRSDGRADAAEPDPAAGEDCGRETGSGDPVVVRETETGTRTQTTSTAGDAGGGGDDPSVDSLTGPMRSLDPRVRLVWVVGSLITAAVLGGITLVVSVFVGRGPLPGVGVFLVVALLGAIHSVYRYRVWCYQVRDDSLYLERGVLTRTKTVVPYVRIQHVDASRSPLERTIGLATSVIYTAGSRGADVTIPGLTPGDADDLQDRLKRLAIAAEGEDAV